MQKIDFEKVSNINIDCVIGLGKDCRVAKNLKTNNLRFFSSPFDWVMQYKLEDDLFLLKNHGKTFFKNYKPNPQYNQKEKIGIVDIDNGMVSMHDFRANLPNKLNHLLFKHKYKI